MNNFVKNLLVFVGGAAVGFIGSSIYYKKKIKKLEEEFDAMDNYYAEMNPTVAPYVKKENTGEKAPEEVKENAAKIESSNSIVRGRMEYKKPDSKDYTSYWKKEAQKAVDPAEKESPEDEYEDSYAQGLIANNEQSRNRTKPPKLISANEYGDQPGYSTVDLRYYQENDFLTVVSDMDEEDILYVDEIENYVGNALVKFDFKHSDEKTIYVRNYQRMTDFMISKVFGSFGEVGAE